MKTERKPNKMTTLTQIMATHNIEIPAHLTADAEIPVHNGLQRQGDIIIIPARPGKTANPTPIPSAGIPVVRGEAGGNTHLLTGTGTWVPHNNDPQTLGTLTVPAGGDAYLLHPEHGATGIAAGTYTIRRQREQADEVRLVAD